MPRKKRVLKKLDAWTQAKQIIVSKPWEFALGVVGLMSLIVLMIIQTLSFSQAKKSSEFSYKAEKKVILKLSPSPKTETSKKTTNREHTLQTGESLWQVAEREYGNPYLYPTLVELNHLESPDAVEPGMKIRVR